MITTNLSGFNTDNYNDQYGSPTFYSKSRMSAIARIMGHGIITEWGGSMDRCPEDKYKTTYRKRRSLFFGWRNIEISSGCDPAKMALKQLPVNAVRDKNSPDHTPCSVLLGALELIGLEGGELMAAQGRLDACGSLARTCKRRAEIDVQKWEKAYSIINSYYRAGGETYLDCTQQQIEDDNAETLDLLAALIEQRDQNQGINNTALLGAIGIGIIGLTYVTLKFIK